VDFVELARDPETVMLNLVQYQDDFGSDVLEVGMRS